MNNTRSFQGYQQSCFYPQKCACLCQLSSPSLILAVSSDTALPLAHSLVITHMQVHCSLDKRFVSLHVGISEIVPKSPKHASVLDDSLVFHLLANYSLPNSQLCSTKCPICLFKQLQSNCYVGNFVLTKYIYILILTQGYDLFGKRRKGRRNIDVREKH